MFTMLNYQEIIGRIEAIRKKEGLSAASFAQRIGVPRSTISHLVSGRNKPSLDLLAKIIDSFPEVTLDALVYGKASPPPQSISGPDRKNEMQYQETTRQSQASLSLESLPTPPGPATPKTTTPLSKTVVRQVILLTEDGHFETYSPKS